MRRAVSFLTLLGGSAPPNESTFLWFPPVGALIGLIIGLTWMGASKIWSPLTAAAIAVALDLLITGMLHMDGLADAADGLIAPMSTTRRLEVMADPSTGAFGVTVLCMVLLTRVAALSSIQPSPLLISGLWCASRTSMVVIARTLRYQRAGGLAESFRNDRPSPSGFERHRILLQVALTGSVLSVGAVILGEGYKGLAALGGSVLGSGAVAILAYRRIAGYTGDVLGAAGVMSETFGLIVGAIR